MRKTSTAGTAKPWPFSAFFPLQGPSEARSVLRGDALTYANTTLALPNGSASTLSRHQR